MVYANFLMKINKKREAEKIKSRIKAIQNKQESKKGMNNKRKKGR
jgi:hypothetical protein